MKYMGSKRRLLQNGLGEILIRESKSSKRIVDPFCGSASVVWYLAERTNLPIIASDLQKYSAILACSVISRTKAIDNKHLINSWLNNAIEKRNKSKFWKASKKIETKRFTKSLVIEARKLCKKISRIGPIWNAYGGYYFSPSQALTFDYLLKYLPKNKIEHSVCLSSIIITASKCAASPGHTAQPFKPTRSAIKFLKESWNHAPNHIIEKNLKEICKKHAKHIGTVKVSDVSKIIPKLRSSDLVIIDTPYSNVHYSRFYHVLETIARGRCKNVSGSGRYPPIDERPQSKFSNKGQSEEAFNELLRLMHEKEVTAILTFPAGKSSNGVSGRKVTDIAKKWFNVEKHIVNGKFSTLGGNNNLRSAREKSKELILILKQKSA